MSSVNFEKIKQNSKPVSAYIGHNDSSERLKHEHSNKDINKDLTSGNVDWKGIDYNAAACRKSPTKSWAFSHICGII